MSLPRTFSVLSAFVYPAVTLPPAYSHSTHGWRLVPAIANPRRACFTRVAAGPSTSTTAAVQRAGPS